MIRFACPSCKSVLSGRDEQAGIIVTCPKCGQRMQVPQPKTDSALLKRARAYKASRRPRIVVPAVICLLLMAGAVGGMWLWTQSFNREAETIHAQNETPPPSSKPIQEAPATEENKPPEEKSNPPLLPSEEHRPSEKRQAPSADVPRSEKAASGPKPAVDVPPPVVEKKQDLVAEEGPSPEKLFDLVDAINAQRGESRSGAHFSR